MDVTTAAPDAHQPEQEPAAGPQHGQDIEQVWRHLLSEVQCGGLCLAEVRHQSGKRRKRLRLGSWLNTCTAHTHTRRP